MSAWGLPSSWKPPDGNPPFLYEQHQQPQQAPPNYTTYPSQQQQEQQQPQQHWSQYFHQQPQQQPQSSSYNYQVPPPPPTTTTTDGRRSPYQTTTNTTNIGQFPQQNAQQSSYEQQSSFWNSTATASSRNNWHNYSEQPPTNSRLYAALAGRGYDQPYQQQPPPAVAIHPSQVSRPTPPPPPPAPPAPPPSQLYPHQHNSHGAPYPPPSSGRGRDAVLPGWMTANSASLSSSSFQPITTRFEATTQPQPPPVTARTTPPPISLYSARPPPTLFHTTAVGDASGVSLSHPTTTTTTNNNYPNLTSGTVSGLGNTTANTSQPIAAARSTRRRRHYHHHHHKDDPFFPPQTRLPVGRGMAATQPAWLTRLQTNTAATGNTTSSSLTALNNVPSGGNGAASASGAVGAAAAAATTTAIRKSENHVTTTTDNEVAGSRAKGADATQHTKSVPANTVYIPRGPTPPPVVPTPTAERGSSVHASGTNQNSVQTASTTISTIVVPAASTLVAPSYRNCNVETDTAVREEDDNEMEFLLCVAIDRMESAMRQLSQQQDPPSDNTNSIVATTNGSSSSLLFLTKARNELQQLVQRLRTRSDKTTGVVSIDPSSSLYQVMMEAENLIQHGQVVLKEATTSVHPPEANNPNDISETLPTIKNDGSITLRDHAIEEEELQGSNAQPIRAEQEQQQEGKMAVENTPTLTCDDDDDDGMQQMADADEADESSSNNPNATQDIAQAPPTDKRKDAHTLAKTKLAKAKLKVGLLKAKAKLLESQKQQQQQQQLPPPDPINASGPPARIPKIMALRLPLTLRIHTTNDADRVALIPVADVDGDGTATNDPETEYTPPGPAVTDDKQLQAVLSQIPRLPLFRRRRQRKRPRYDEDDGEAIEPSTEQPKLSRKDLLQRRQQAEQRKAVILCKNLIVKHEVLEAEQRAKLQATQQTLERTQTDLHQLNDEIQRNQRSIEKLKSRKQVIDELTHEYVTKLVSARKALHEHNLAMEGSERS